MGTGSYVITRFTKKLRENIMNNNNKKFLFEICSDIQKELHNKGKQHTVNTFNDDTQYIKFLENKSKNICSDDTDCKLPKIEEDKQFENDDKKNEGRTDNQIELTDISIINKLDSNDKNESDTESECDTLVPRDGTNGKSRYSH